MSESKGVNGFQIHDCRPHEWYVKHGYEGFYLGADKRDYFGVCKCVSKYVKCKTPYILYADPKRVDTSFWGPKVKPNRSEDASDYILAGAAVALVLALILGAIIYFNKKRGGDGDGNDYFGPRGRFGRRFRAKTWAQRMRLRNKERHIRGAGLSLPRPETLMINRPNHEQIKGHFSNLIDVQFSNIDKKRRRAVVERMLSEEFGVNVTISPVGPIGELMYNHLPGIGPLFERGKGMVDFLSRPIRNRGFGLSRTQALHVQAMIEARIIERDWREGDEKVDLENPEMFSDMMTVLARRFSGKVAVNIEDPGDRFQYAVEFQLQNGNPILNDIALFAHLHFFVQQMYEGADSEFRKAKVAMGNGDFKAAAEFLDKVIINKGIDPVAFAIKKALYAGSLLKEANLIMDPRDQEQGRLLYVAWQNSIVAVNALEADGVMVHDAIKKYVSSVDQAVIKKTTDMIRLADEEDDDTPSGSPSGGGFLRTASSVLGGLGIGGIGSNMVAAGNSLILKG